MLLSLLQFLQAFKSPGKAQPVSMLLDAGRSFSPAVMSQLDVDEVDSAFHGEGDRVSIFFGEGDEWVKVDPEEGSANKLFVL